MKDKRPTFGIFYQDISKALRPCTPTEKDVFWHMADYAGYGNFVNQTATAIAREIGIHRTHVSEALRSLEKRDFVVKCKYGVYMVNPCLIRKGDAESYQMIAVYQEYKQRRREDGK